MNCRGLINIDPESGELPPPVAGESAQARFERGRAAHAAHLRVIAPVMAAVAFTFSIAVYFLTLPYGGPIWASVAAAAAALSTVYMVVKSPRDVVSWDRGAEAERRVGARLDELQGRGFVTLYDRRFPGRGGNLDAVTVGPTGVFAVETKYRRKGVDVINGRLEVGGWEQNELIAQAVDEALRVQVSIAPDMNERRVTVVPVLCFVGRKIDDPARVKGVIVTDERHLAARIAALPPVLAPDEVQALARQLDHALPRNER